jgi:hypothetical protein
MQPGQSLLLLQVPSGAVLLLPATAAAELE